MNESLLNSTSNASCTNIRLGSEFYGHTFLTAFSLFTNVITIWVIFPERKKNTPNFLMLILAFVDFICPILYYLYYFLKITCFTNIVFYLMQVAKTYESYVIVLISIDRFIAIKFPLKSGILCNLLRIKISLVIILLVMFCIKVPSFKFAHHFEAYVDPFISYYIPLLSILIFNFILIKELSRQSKGALTTGIGIDVKRIKQNHRQHRHRNVTITLICIVVIFVILETPTTIYIIIGQENSVFYSVCLICNSINFSINIFVYGLIGKKFRQLLRRKIQNLFISNNNKSVNIVTQTVTIPYDSVTLSQKVRDNHKCLHYH